MSTSKNNLLIAIFMGYRKIEDTSVLTDDKTELWLQNTSKENDVVQGVPNYQDSWDLLMSVVDRIEQNSITVSIDKERVWVYGQMYSHQNPTLSHEEKINVVYQSVLHYITWYNSQSK